MKSLGTSHSPTLAPSSSPKEANTALLQDDVQAAAASLGQQRLRELGYDPESFWEQPIVWGDHDSFQYALGRLPTRRHADRRTGMSIMYDTVRSA